MSTSTTTAPKEQASTDPPAPPTSLLDLPLPWLLKLVTCVAFGRRYDKISLVPLFRTCTVLRDMVVRHRKAALDFSVPIAAEDFPRAAEKLCTLARRSSNISLEFFGPDEVDEDVHPPPASWFETEPHITHLLVCAMAELGGKEALLGVKDIYLQNLEQTALVPAWARVLCPNVERLDSIDHLITRHLPTTDPSPLLPLQHLQHLEWYPHSDLEVDQRMTQHLQAQLAALPSLTSLTTSDAGDWLVGAAEVSSSNLTLLTCINGELLDVWPLLPAQFPGLVELHGDYIIRVDDAGLEALLSMPHLQRVNVHSIRLQHNHAHQRPIQPWRLLKVQDLDVVSFALLPLDSIQACSYLQIKPSRDAQAVERVAQAVRRWGQLSVAREYLSFCASDSTALLTTLGPLLAALPTAQQQHLAVHSLQQATPDVLQRLGQQLPASITRLSLSGSLAAEAYPTLLPSLPPTVTHVEVDTTGLKEEELLGMCLAAVRPIAVRLPGGTAAMKDRATEAGRGLVTVI